MTAPRFSFVRASANRKTGPMPVTNTDASTCPNSCALKGAGCYAETGPVGWQWSKRTAPGVGLSLAELCRYIRTIGGGQLWRHNVAGDLPGAGETIDADALAKITRANRGRRGFTYTHKPDTPANIAAIKTATAAGFTVNLSADNGADADRLARHGLPLVTIIPADAGKVSHTPAGRKIVLCPAESSDRVTCVTCGICALPARPYIIGFKPKGARRRMVEQLAKGEL